MSNANARILTEPINGIALQTKEDGQVMLHENIEYKQYYPTMKELR